MKSLSKILLALYVLILLWLLLFKSSFDVLAVFEHHRRSLNLIPLAGNGLNEMISNVIVFVPLGLLLGTSFKQKLVRRKLAFVLALSCFVEFIQLVFAIGATDISDALMNTLGGALGLALYSLSRRYDHDEKLDRLICMIVSGLLIICILLRTLVFKVKY